MSFDSGPCERDDGEEGDDQGDDQRGGDQERRPLSPARDVLRFYPVRAQLGDDGTLLGQAQPLQQQPDERAGGLLGG